MTEQAPKPPKGLKLAGTRAWRLLVSADLEFLPNELLLVEEAARIVDVLAELRGGEVDARTMGEVRRQQEQLRKILGGVTWPYADEGVGTAFSEWGRQAANRRWRMSGTPAQAASKRWANR